MWVYDPWGKRVGWRHPRSYQEWDHQESECEVNFYGIMGRELATYRCGYHDLEDGDGSFYWSLKGYRVYLGGELIEEDGVSVKTDRLGSVRVNGKGERFHYLPYGEEYPATVNGRVKFGTYFRDSSFYESSTIPPSIDPSTLYYADQRYYDPVRGRFMTPDPSGMDAVNLSDPGSWNMYAYVGDDPINFNDPSGLGPVTLPPVVPGVNCSTAFINYAAQFGESIQQLFDSDQGILGVMDPATQDGVDIYMEKRMVR